MSPRLGVEGGGCWRELLCASAIDGCENQRGRLWIAHKTCGCSETTRSKKRKKLPPRFPRDNAAFSPRKYRWIRLIRISALGRWAWPRIQRPPSRMNIDRGPDRQPVGRTRRRASTRLRYGVCEKVAPTLKQMPANALARTHTHITHARAHALTHTQALSHMHAHRK